MFFLCLGNIAFNKTASLSSQYCPKCTNIFVPSLAIDGKIGSRLQANDSSTFGNCSKTENNETSWLMIDFGYPHIIFNLTIFGNTDSK